MIYEIKDEYIGRCTECGRKYVCNKGDVQSYEYMSGKYLICPFCGTKIKMILKEE